MRVSYGNAAEPVKMPFEVFGLRWVQGTVYRVWGPGSPRGRQQFSGGAAFHKNSLTTWFECCGWLVSVWDKIQNV